MNDVLPLQHNLDAGARQALGGQIGDVSGGQRDGVATDEPGTAAGNVVERAGVAGAVHLQAGAQGDREGLVVTPVPKVPFWKLSNFNVFQPTFGTVQRLGG